MLSKSLLPCLLLAAAAAPALAQDATTTATGQFVLEGKVEVKELVDRAAHHLGWNILLNQQEMANACTGGSTFDLQGRIATDAAGCQELLTTMLYVKGFAMITLDADKNLYEVIALNGPRAREVFSSAKMKSPEEILARPTLRSPVTTVVQLKHTHAQMANNSLRPFFASSGPHQGGLTIGNVGNQTAILLTGMQNQVATAIRMLQKCDVPSDDAQNMPSLKQELAALKTRVAALEKALAKQTKGK